jgi:amino acid adenylation domain-containing protein
LFETLLSFQEPAWDAPLKARGGPWLNRDFEVRAQPNFPLALEVLAGDTLTAKAIYHRHRCRDEGVAGMLGQWRVVLEALAAGACERVRELPLLTTRESHRILREWNQTAVDYPRDGCVHVEVERRAARRPHRVAVADVNGALTYGELNARANRLAHALNALRVDRHAAVAICMNRSTEMVVAWLAVLKSGAAFVPLDPSYPPERLAFQLDDAGAGVVLAQPAFRATLANIARNAAVIEVLPDGSGFEGQAETNPSSGVSARDLAYVIYTSGSTGRPKGVEVEHRALMNLVTWHRRHYAVTPDDRATHLASPAFDASIWEIWPYLCAGASVHIPDDETRLSAEALWGWLARQGITFCFAPTPLAEALLSTPWPAGLALRALLTGGDTLKRRPPAGFPCVLVNHYGPTESSVVATCAPVASQPGGTDAPTIGRPIANTRVYLLDSELRPVPAGVAGELFIGGESLARGYRRRAELTATRFVTVQLPDEAPQRLYRTGDLVRWNEAGEIEFLGRIDGQVKIRGCRVEPGEIEAVLQQHPATQGSLALARPDARGELQLVAYAVVQPGAAAATETELSAFLRAKLPAYMVPAAIVLLEAWPLTANGKIDRRALPAPDGRASVGAISAPPQSPTERTVAKIWAEVLGHSEPGLNDNFFDLGGHSLLAAQVVARLNASLPGAISVRALFDQPTLAGFAREVDRVAQGESGARGTLRPKRRASRPQLELVPPT